MNPSTQPSEHVIQEILSALPRERAELMPAPDALADRAISRKAAYFTSRRPL